MHILQPKHTKLSSEEEEKILNKFNISKAQLPKIILGDIGLPEDCQIGNIIKIERKEENKTHLFYRVVV